MRKLTPEEKIISKQKRKQFAKEYYLKNKDKIDVYRQMWRDKNKEKIKQYNKELVKIRNNIRLEALLAAGNACSKCGFKYDGKNKPVFEFHHPDPKYKVIIMSHPACIPKMREEIKNCVVLCANCHRMEHYKEGEEWYRRL